MKIQASRERGSHFSLLTEKEKHRILIEWNQTQTNYPKNKTIHQIFEENVEKTPHAAALVHENMVITYRELNNRANRLANYLRDKYNIPPDTIVGIMIEPAIDMIVGILGILKAGGAYLPIDAGYPKNRVRAMLEDCQVSILLTNNSSIENHPFTGLQNLQPIKSKLRQTTVRPRIADLDAVQIPDRSLVNYEKYNKYISHASVKNCLSLQATRGCPYKCAYCHKIWSKKHVFRSAGNIFAEIQHYYNIGVRRFAFIDDIFNLNIKNSRKFFQLIVENGLDVQLFFPSGMRGDLLTEDYIDLMVKAGVTGIALALETASARLQELIGKRLNIDKLKKNIRYFCEKYPFVILELFTMHGFPTETKEEALKTLDFIKSMKWIHFPYINILRIFPNTDMEKLALENNISREAINQQDDLTQNEFADTLPFEKSFTLKYQADFLNDYFLLKERLLHVLPYQMKVLTEDEIAQKYNSYLPVKINKFSDLLELIGIKKDELSRGDFLKEECMSVPALHKKITNSLSPKKPGKNALRVLLLDLSQFFSEESHLIYDVIEPPLGLMYLMTYLHRQLGNKIKGKIAKSRIDFDSYGELKVLLEEFKPQVIGIRTLTLYKEFFHKSIAMIRHWGIDVPIITGGPYATSDYTRILHDRNIDLVVTGEGEITFCELVEKIIKNDGKLPGDKILNEIPGIVYVPKTSNLDHTSHKLAREIIMLDELDDILALKSPKNVEHPGDSSANLAYIIFTSGSTGKPKGVCTAHYNVTRVVKNSNYIDLTGQDRVLQLSNYTFDGSVFDIYGALLNRSSLVIVSQEVLMALDRLADLIKREQITVFFITTALFNTLVELKLDCFANIRKVLFGGEQVSAAHTRKALEYLGKDRIIHVYGPTESTVYTTYYFTNQIDDRANTIPIGKPVSNTFTYILDKNKNPVSIGVIGEIYIGGDGVARGYLNNPELTLERFLYRLYRSYKSYRSYIYRTGDLGKFLPDGNIVFSGRIDNQVKVRGFRIELGEIENQLLTHEIVSETVVTLKEDNSGDKYLCAYIIAERKAQGAKRADINASELRKYLSARLPDYMIPVYFVFLDRIPLTYNGKVDRKVLPDPELPLSQGYLAPRDEIEKKLAEIWANTLGIDKKNIGIDDSFFELGGQSLKTIKAASMMHKAFNVQLTTSEMFKIPTIRGISSYIKGAVEDKFVSIEAVEKKEFYALSSAQKRIYVIRQIDPESTSYNVPTSVILEGKFDGKRIENTFKKLINRHESLRTSFEIVENEPVQRVHDQVEFEIEYNDLYRTQVEVKVKVEEKEQKTEDRRQKTDKKRQTTENRPGTTLSSVFCHLSSGFLRPFDLSRPPLLRVGVQKIHKEKYLLTIDKHHIIADGVSHSILVREFSALYREETLPGLRVHYKDFSQWQNKKILHGEMKKQEEYWLNRFKEKIPVLKIPMDYDISRVKSNESRAAVFEIAPGEAGRLRELAREEDATMFMVVLALFNTFLYKITLLEDILIGTVVAGRRHQDLDNIIGMFVNTLALRNFPKGDKPFVEFLKEVKKITLEAFDNQDYQFQDLVEKVVKERDPGRNPLFDVLFSFTPQNTKNASNSDQWEPGLKVKPYGRGEGPNLGAIPGMGAKFDMLFTGKDTGENLSFAVEYRTELFKKETIEIFIECFKQVVSAVKENESVKLKSIKISHDLGVAAADVYKRDKIEFEF